MKVEETEEDNTNEIHRNESKLLPGRKHICFDFLCYANLLLILLVSPSRVKSSVRRGRRGERQRGDESSLFD